MGFSFCGMTVPIMDVTARDKRMTTESFIDAKKPHSLCVKSSGLADLVIILAYYDLMRKITIINNK